MTGIVETDLVFFAGASGGGSQSDCDQVTDWAPSVTLDTELKVQGNGCVGIKVSNTSSLITFSLTGTVDLTSTMVYFWAMFADPLARLADKSGGGLGIRIESSASDYVEWYIAGKDTWTGGWKAFAQHTDAPADDSGGSVVKGSINAISIRWTTTQVAKVSPNCYWDAIRFGKYLRIRGGTPASPASFDDFISAEENTVNCYGILERISGVLMCQGNLEFGSPTTWPTYFKDKSEALVFKLPPNTIPVHYYNMTINGNTVDFTSVFFGEKSGDAGISGCLFRTSGYAKYKFVAEDPDINTFGLYGCSFFDANTISFGTLDTQKEVLNTSFEEGAVVLAKAFEFRNCNFITADDVATFMELNHDITNSNFINNPRAVRIDTAGTFQFDALIFSGNSIDIYNTSAGTVEVQCLNQANPTSQDNPNGGTVDIVNMVYLTIWVEDEVGDPITNVQCAIFTDPGMVQLMNKETDGSGKAEVTYNYVGDQAVSVRIREAGYIPVYQLTTIGSGGLLLYITMYDDPSYTP